MPKKSDQAKSANIPATPLWHPCDEFVDPLIRAIEPFCKSDDEDTIRQVIVDVTGRLFHDNGSRFRYWMEWNFGTANADRLWNRVNQFAKTLADWSALNYLDGRRDPRRFAVELHAVQTEAIQLFGYLRSLGEQIRQQITFENLNADNRFVPTPFQRMLLNALHGRSMTQLAMMSELDVGSKETFNGKDGRGGMKELIAEGLVNNDRRKGGYWRPDAPPVDAG